jgi:HSP20 family molecular chaperone IbpA
MTFQDLLEYFAYLCPALNICQCYHFRGINPDKQIINISKSHKLSDHTYYFKNIILYRNGNKCEHSAKGNNLYFLSKLDIISSFYKKMNQAALSIDKKNNQIKVNNFKQTIKDFYDVVVKIDSIIDIAKKGWAIEMNKGEENYNKYKDESLLKIGVIGNANKGKSHLLSKISKMDDLPSGVSIKTEGLSIKYPELSVFKDRKIVLLDSAGFETPVLISGEKSENKEKNKQFKEKSKEKLITELFLQNYIINNSNILIVVVDSLSFSEQKLIMKVKKEMERSKINIPLYIIHNLKMYTTKEEVEDYINNILFKSATFTLKQGIKVTMNMNSEDVYYYYEINEEKDQKGQNVFHLIYANEGSEAGNIYNPYVLEFMKNSFQQNTNLQPFDVIKTIKERYIKVSQDIIEKGDKDEKIDINSFDTTNPKLIKLKNESEIKLKRCLIDEIGLSNFKANGFEPVYNIFKKDNKLIVRVETPGNCKISTSKIETQEEYNVIKLTGEKIKDEEPKNLDENIINLRELGKFCLEIPLKTSEFNLYHKKPKVKIVNGVHILEYDLQLEDTGIDLSQSEQNPPTI